jgi:hypothetical protein
MQQNPVESSRVTKLADLVRPEDCKSNREPTDSVRRTQRQQSQTIMRKVSKAKTIDKIAVWWPPIAIVRLNEPEADRGCRCGESADGQVTDPSPHNAATGKSVYFYNE